MNEHTLFPALSNSLALTLIALRGFATRTVDTTRPGSDLALLIEVGKHASTHKIQAIKGLRGAPGSFLSLIQAKKVIDTAVEAYQASLAPTRDWLAEAEAGAAYAQDRNRWDSPSYDDEPF